ncbi:hypothetical protein Drose_12690 [Dactylosporangium roseum]|uniref:Flagellar hook-length control protein FliK n=1 Tax=Dactylosporangium roseum TaxID=47989 RepID=A0ABY5ZAD3_9ACTN|nr:hypothetical protein [Dactylosporangium roseum]UWZ38996.1 hypothetical protein Drose_12690 [Dactylosporangium roseum]
MTSALRRWAAALAAAFALAGALVLAEPAPRAAHAAACAPGAGVTVVVDFGPLGGGVVVGCQLGDPPTGLAALTGAGFTVTGTQRWGLAFVCRIDGRPTAATEPCVNTPPASAYWSYWHATPGGAWTYGTLGASSYNPAPGTVEGWRFGSGQAPSITAP